MPQFYFHYTCRTNAQRIIALGKLKPQKPGQRIWLTEDFYNRGAVATKNLSIPTEVIELVCVIPAIDIDDSKITLSVKRAVDKAVWDQERNKTGGGSEYSTFDEIDVTRATWIELSSP